MKRTKRIITLLLAALMLLSVLPVVSASDMFENSDFIDTAYCNITYRFLCGKYLCGTAYGGRRSFYG